METGNPEVKAEGATIQNLEITTQPPNVFIVMPSHDNKADLQASRSIMHTASQRCTVLPQPLTGSLLSHNCTALWAEVLNANEVADRNPQSMRFHYWAMLHTDVEPPAWWIDTLLEEAITHDADFISAVIPIKSQTDDGITSTAISNATHQTNPYDYATRLTVRQVNHPKFPPTFNIFEAKKALNKLPYPLRLHVPNECEYLLANTGCCLVRLGRPWNQKVWFEDWTTMDRSPEGHWRAKVFSEDWFFTKRIAEEGGRVFATTKIKPRHRGTKWWSTEAIYGKDIDPHGTCKT